MKSGAITFGNDTRPGTGSVTSVAVAGLAPIFTAAVANPNTTPSVTFAQIAKAANLVFAGPASGAAANPDFRALVHADLPGILTRTVAQMQALAAVNGFFPGTFYRITDVYGNRGAFTFLAESVNTISIAGGGVFQNASMLASVEAFIFYDLTTDFINTFEDATNGNFVTQLIPGAIDNIKFDTALYNRIINCTCSGDAWYNYGNLSYNDLKLCFLAPVFGDTLAHNTADEATLAGGGEIGTIYGNQVGNLASIALGGTAGVGHVVSGCIIGPGKNLDLSSITASYIATNKVYIDGLSTFELTAAQYTINPDVSRTVNLGGLLWPGILIPDDGANDLSTFSNGPTAHTVYWRPSATTITVNDTAVPVIGGNIVCYVSASILPVDGIALDWVSMEYNAAAGQYVTVIERIRT